ncbi:DISARM system phospholipase D-like protein DrmC [Streptomyces sp. NPDC059175]|uniref:DISARM system phospholipase D-like protein DrmC n=1 Tax=Streptomyces sp. NPDC059175 TaxID=3346757 RepID=UPI0036A6DAC3
MTDPITTVQDLARELPSQDLYALSVAAGGGIDGLRDLRAQASSNIIRRACSQLIACLAHCSPDYLAGALAAVAAADTSRKAQAIDVVWTGPHTRITSSRLTAHSITTLIDEARHEIWLVSYATHTEPRITAALKAAAGRGVQITLLLERNTDNPSYSFRGIPFPHLDATRLAWPAARRSARHTSLHAKILVTDGSTALVGSANITGAAMETNLECGILLRGGPHPRAIRAHLAALHEQGDLIRC